MKHFYSSLKERYQEYRSGVNLKTKLLKKKKAILVHQMGKVGPSSVVKSLRDLTSDISVYHTHFLNYQRLNKQLQAYRQKGKKLPGHLKQSQGLHKLIADRKNNINWKVITLVREPISRNISAFFQNLDGFIPGCLQQYRSGSISIEEIIDVFLVKYPHELPLNWLDWEIKSVFDIDVFSVDFPKSDGFFIFRHENVELLLLRLENLGESSHKAFADFLEVESFVIKKNNLAQNKEYFEVYGKVRQSIVFPQEYIDKMYASKYVQHFYSKDEIDRFRAKWLRLHSEQSQ